MQPPLDLPNDSTHSYIPEGKPIPANPAPAEGTLPTWQVSAQSLPQMETEGTGVAKQESAYQLVRVIGRGGMGEVWEAIQVSLSRVVAVKRARLGEGFESNSEKSRRKADFTREAVVAGRLEHPNIVPVHDLGLGDDGNPMLAMKLVEGSPWDDILKKDFLALSATDIVAKHIPILIAMTQAVAFAHSRGIVHRDLKPAQVMIGDFGEVMLTDWGLAIVMAEARTPLPVSTRVPLPTVESASSPSGTPALMAPEQTRESAREIGPWTDLYLIGGTLYYILTQSFPHHAKTAREAFQRAAEGVIEAPSVRAAGREIPAELEALTLRCLARDPKGRPQSAVEVLDALRDFLSGASKRRESQALTSEAAAQLAKDEAPSYESLETLGSTLSRAAELWVENPAIPELRERTYSLYARTALDGQDLKLARLQAGRLRAGERRTGLLNAIGAAEKRIASERRTRRVAIGSSIGLLVMLVAGGCVSSYHFNRAKQLAVNERDVATRALLRSDELIGFMLNDLRQSVTALDCVDPLVRVDLLKGIARKSLDTYKAQYSEPHSEADAERIVKGLTSVHDLLIESENLGMAEETVDVAIDLSINESKVAGNDRKKWLGNWGALRGKAAAIYGRLGREEDRLAAIHDQTKVMEEIITEEPKNVEVMQFVMTSLAQEMEALGDLGKYDEAAKLLPRLEATRDRILGLDPKNYKARRYYASGLLQLGDTLLGQQKNEEAVEVYKKAGALLWEIHEEDAGEEKAYAEYLVSLNRLGNALMRVNRFGEAREAYEKRTERLDELIKKHPTDLHMRRELALSYINRGDVKETTDDFDGASADYLIARDYMEELCAREPDNMNWRWALAGAWYKYGSAQWSKKYVLEAAWGYASAAEIAGIVDPRTTSVEFMNISAVSRVAVAKSAVVLGQPDQAEEYLRPLLAEGEIAKTATKGAAMVYSFVLPNAWVEMAKCQSLRGDVEGCFAAMRSAVEAGYDPEELLTDRDLEAAKYSDNKRFVRFVEEMCVIGKR